MRARLTSTIVIALLALVMASRAECQVPPATEPSPALDFLSLGTAGFDYTQGSYSLGWTFKVTSAVRVTALGFYDDKKNGLTQAHPVGIYDLATKALVATTTVMPSDPPQGFFRYRQITPVQLGAGKSYAVQAVTGSEKYAVNVNPVTLNPAIEYTGFAYTNNGSATQISFPTSFTGDIFGSPLPAGFHGDFGPGFLIASSTEPGPLTELIVPANNSIVSPLPNFRLKATDPDNRRVFFEVDIQGPVNRTLITGDVASGQVVSTPIVLPAEALPPGKYTWNARAIPFVNGAAQRAGPWSLKDNERRPFSVYGGVDLSRPLPPEMSVADRTRMEQTWRAIRDAHFSAAVVQARGDATRNPQAVGLLAGARRNALKTAAYVRLDFDYTVPATQTAPGRVHTARLSGDCQAKQALASIAQEGRFLSFMAVDVERIDGAVYAQDRGSVTKRLETIAKAVATLQIAGIRPIIYANKTNWDLLAGGTSDYDTLDLWVPRYDWVDDLKTDAAGSGGHPFDGWETFGGWQQVRQDKPYLRQGKQYLGDVSTLFGITAVNRAAKVDLNVFDPKLFEEQSPNFAPAPKLTFTATSTRNGTVVIAVRNEGTADASGVWVTGAKLGNGRPTARLPRLVGNGTVLVCDWDGRAPITIAMSFAGATGTVLTITGVYNGGTFSVLVPVVSIS